MKLIKKISLNFKEINPKLRLLENNSEIPVSVQGVVFKSDSIPILTITTGKNKKEETPVEKCYRYIANRQENLDYKSALEKNLPIGSGEIESSHRYVIQKRLKIAGAWWNQDVVECMLSLRTLRFNGDWIYIGINKIWPDYFAYPGLLIAPLQPVHKVDHRVFILSFFFAD